MKAVIVVSLMFLIPIALALQGSGNGYSVTGNIGSMGGREDASGINVSVTSPTFAVKQSNSTHFYGGVFCVLNRPPTIVQTSISPTVANTSQTVTISAVMQDNDTDSVRVKAYNGTDKGTLLCTGSSVASGGNSSCSFTASSAGCGAGACNIYLYAEETSLHECDGYSFSVGTSTVSFTNDIAYPSIFNPVPNTTSVGYTKQAGNFRLNFSYTEVNPRNYSVEIYNGSTQICYNTSTSPTGGEGINASITCGISGSAIEGYYTYRMTLFDTTLQSTQNTQTDAVLIDNMQPTGTLTISPTVTVNGTQYAKGIIPLNATAADTSSGISYVEWYYDSTSIGSDGTSPYGIDWDTSTIPDGTYNITARIYDRSGNMRIVG
jgi:hypothetical protein